MVEEGRGVTGLPVDDARNLFWIFRVYEDVVVMQIIMPEASLGGDCIFREKSANDLSVAC